MKARFLSFRCLQHRWILGAALFCSILSACVAGYGANRPAMQVIYLDDKGCEVFEAVEGGLCINYSPSDLSQFCVTVSTTTRLYGVRYTVKDFRPVAAVATVRHFVNAEGEFDYGNHEVITTRYTFPVSSVQEMGYSLQRTGELAWKVILRKEGQPHSAAQ